MAYGRFRTINLGDLTWNGELDLMCPTNRIGTVDVYLTSHHGLDRSGSPALVHALRPRVAVMNNGTRKGGRPTRSASCTNRRASRTCGSCTGPTTWASTMRRHLRGERRRQRDGGGRPDAAPAGAWGRPSGRARRPSGGGAAAHTPAYSDQDHRRAGRHVHRHQHTQRVPQDLQAAGVRRRDSGPTRQVTVGVAESNRVTVSSLIGRAGRDGQSASEALIARAVARTSAAARGIRFVCSRVTGDEMPTDADDLALRVANRRRHAPHLARCTPHRRARIPRRGPAGRLSPAR